GADLAIHAAEARRALRAIGARRPDGVAAHPLVADARSAARGRVRGARTVAVGDAALEVVRITHARLAEDVGAARVSERAAAHARRAAHAGATLAGARALPSVGLRAVGGRGLASVRGRVAIVARDAVAVAAARGAARSAGIADARTARGGRG